MSLVHDQPPFPDADTNPTPPVHTFHLDAVMGLRQQ